MLKKVIQFDDLDENTVQDVFYFNYTKLELVELGLDNLEEKIKRLQETSDAKEVYGLFKEIVLGAYGKKSLDNRRFDKSPEIRREFEMSPALSELIFSFIENPQEGAEFIEKCLPQKLVKEAREFEAQQVKQTVTSSDISAMVTEADRRQQDPATRIEPSEVVLGTAAAVTEKEFDNYSDEELLTMPDNEYNRLVPSQPKDMTKRQMLIGMQRMQNSK